MPDKRKLPCPACRSDNTRRNGTHKISGAQKAYCCDCGKHFRQRYKYKARQHHIERRIDKLTNAGLSVRAIAAKLKISPTTVQVCRAKLRAQYQACIAEPYKVEPADLHIIAWSGGKDSSALLVWAREHLPPEKTVVVFCDTGWESPLTYQFIEDINQRLLEGKLITLKNPKYDDLLDLARKRHRFPSVKARFCTEELKVIPMFEFILRQSGHIAVYQGIRAAESTVRARMRPSDEYFLNHLLYDREPTILVNGKPKRRRRPALQSKVMAWLERNECTVHRPFFYWNTADVLALCRQHNVLNPLYDLGVSRVGCFPCIMENKEGIRAIALNALERIDLLERVEQEMGHTFFPYSKVPDSQCAKPGIRDVVKWAFSNALPEQQPSNSCLGHYAQCE